MVYVCLMSSSTTSSRAPRLVAADVAEQLRCTPLTARRLMSTGAIASAKIAERWTTTQDDIDAYVEGQSTASPNRRRRARRAS